MKHGDIRALEDERDPERRKELVERLLAATDIAELWGAMSTEQKAVCLRATDFNDHTRAVWAHGNTTLDMATFREWGACPTCGDECCLTFHRRANIIVESQGYGDIIDPDSPLIMWAQCDACGAGFFYDEDEV